MPVLTSNAAKRIKELGATEKAGATFRVSVDGGGCSGFKYRFDFDVKQNADDTVIETDGVKALIDAVSLGFLGNSHIDYVETLGESYFSVKNPNAKASCGCGNSFAV
ncbi:MAG: iron-sulfur cluster insertion protein ErpA [Proteobacteria bacterium]|nr:iron-sulfur cluster insertion protein ErpA [Pseudomonadota bacterium]